MARDTLPQSDREKHILKSVMNALDDFMLEVKKRTTEGEENPQMPVIREFIETETARQKEIADNLDDDHNRDWSVLNSIFSEIITGKKHS